MKDITFLMIKCRSAGKILRIVIFFVTVSPDVFENLRRAVGMKTNESINLLFTIFIDMTLLPLETIFGMHCCCSYNHSRMGKKSDPLPKCAMSHSYFLTRSRSPENMNKIVIRSHNP